MRLTYRRDLRMDLTPDGRVRYRSVGAGLEGIGPADAILILSFCAEPRTRDEVAARFGPGGGAAFDAMHQGGLLVSPEEADDTPLFFDTFSSLDIHRRMLSDRVRVEAYAEALRALVTPESVVLDAGTGTGVLACIAAACGARKVYAVDRAKLDMAREVVTASGFGDRVELIQGDLRSLTLPEKVDLVVSETFGAMAFSEGGMADVAACCVRNLAEGGLTIPARVSLWVAPIVDASELHDTPDVFRATHGADLSPMRAAAYRRGVVTPIPPSALGAAPQCLSNDPFPDAPIEQQATLRFENVTGDQLLGWACWFDLEMAPGQSLTTAPGAPLTHWQQQFLPVDHWPLTSGPLTVEIGFRPAPSDRRGLEVASRWSQDERSDSLVHRVV